MLKLSKKHLLQNNNKKPLVSINIVTYNSDKYFRYVFPAILDQTIQDFEINIIDNGSSKNPFPKLKKHLSVFNYKRNKKNVGFAAGHNQAINISRGKYILCLNDDILLTSNYIEKIISHLELNQKCAGAQGKIFKWDFEKGKLTHLIDSCGIGISKSQRFYEIGGEQHDSKHFSKTKKIFAINGAAPIYRKSALNRIKQQNGYFDESFWMYKEDIDLSWRLRNAGYNLYFLPSAICYHDRWQTGSSKKTLETAKKRVKKNALCNKLSYANHFKTIIKNQTGKNLLKYSPYIISYEFSKLLYILAKEQKTLLALPQLIRDLPLTMQHRNDILKSNNRPLGKLN